MNTAAALPTVIPLIGAALAMLLHRWLWVQRGLAVVSLAAGLGVSIALVVHADREGPALARLGGWSEAIGISYRIDRFAGLMLVVAFVTLLAVLVFAIGESSATSVSPVFHPIYLTMAAGICAAFSTYDLFHLFVAFEILLMSSYVLLTLDGNPQQVRSGTTYVVINTIESAVLVAAIGLIYASTGTLSMAELPARLAQLSDGVRTGLHLLLLVAFGLKAAVFPLFFWLPDSYPAARSPITAVFAGLLTKIGVYAILRTQTHLFPGELDELVLWVGVATMVIGVLGAIAQNEIKRILSFHIVSQVGYMITAIGIGGPLALSAAMFFVLYHVPTKSSLFLVEGIVEHGARTSHLDKLSGLVHRAGWLAALFLLSALSLAGIPPFSGFVAKLGVITAGLDAGEHVAVGAAIVTSLLTLVSMAKIWTGAFWGSAADMQLGRAPATVSAAQRDDEFGWRVPWPMIAATVGMVTVGLGLAVAAGPLYALCERAAADVLAIDVVGGLP